MDFTWTLSLATDPDPDPDPGHSLSNVLLKCSKQISCFKIDPEKFLTTLKIISKGEMKGVWPKRRSFFLAFLYSFFFLTF
jgi:hypothetical protein